MSEGDPSALELLSRQVASNSAKLDRLQRMVVGLGLLMSSVWGADAIWGILG